MSDIKITTTEPAKKTIKSITFRRPATKNYYECYELTYKDFAAKIRKDGWDGKEVKDGSLIKKIWEELAEETGCDNAINIDADVQHDGDDEDWDEDDAEENVWMYIHDEVIYTNSFPECAEEGCVADVINEGEKCEECSKTPEQKAEDEERHKKHKESMLASLDQRAAESKKQAEEYATKMDAHWTICNVESIKTAVVKAEQFFKPKTTGELPPMLSREAMERVRNNRRCEILAEMSKLVAELEEVAKW
jgi:hypothetical protein